MKLTLTKTLEIPEGVAAEIEGSTLKIKGPAGEDTHDLGYSKLVFQVKEGVIEVTANNATKKDKALLGSAVAHIKNKLEGVNNKFTYELKVCSGHFPMNISVKDGKLSVKNFLGEKVPRTLTLDADTEVKVQGEKITIESVSKEAAGQQAAAIETLTRVTNKDRRIFQDGIFITAKPSRKME